MVDKWSVRDVLVSFGVDFQRGIASAEKKLQPLANFLLLSFGVWNKG